MRAALVLLLLLSLCACGDDASTPTNSHEPLKCAGENPVVIIDTSMGAIHVELFCDAAPKTVETFVGLAEGTVAWTDPKTRQAVKRPLYDGLVFHRVIADFMIQGGCPLGTGTSMPIQIDDEMCASALGLDKMTAFENGMPHPYLYPNQTEIQRHLVQPAAKKLGITSNADMAKRQKELMKELESVTLEELYERAGFAYQDGLPSKPMVRGVIAMANTGRPNTNGSQFFLTVVDRPMLTGRHTVFGKVIEGMDVVDAISVVKTGPGDRPLTPVKIHSIRRKP